MRVGIIGCGAAGLSAIKQCLDENLECVAFEQGDKIGGTWNYYEKMDEKNVLSLHSSMYYGLTTNLPKEVMELDGFHYKDLGISFITQSEVLQYLEDYAEHFRLHRYIKFHHEVKLVDPLPGGKWTIHTRNMQNGQLSKYTFDAILLCNGHYTNPFYPSIKGMEYFKDRSMHSHYFKTPEKYRKKKVLLIGGGPSGFDISRVVSEVADKVYLSSRRTEHYSYPNEKTILKPGISHFNQNTVEFVDGTVEEIDEIMYCTGYNTTFPFLSEKCKLKVDENWVHPLYKHTISIEHPTMAVISVVSIVTPFPLFGLQVRFFLAHVLGKVKISKQEMYEDFEEDTRKRVEKGLPKQLAHFIGPQQLEYCEELSELAKIRGVPRVVSLIFKFHIEVNKTQRANYTVINDNEFTFKSV